MTLQFLYDIIKTKYREGHTAIIGLDGCGGAGKTTIATHLCEKDTRIAIIHMDEFDLPFEKRLQKPPHEKPIGGDCEWQRLIDEVLIPLRHNKPAKFQKYSWDLDRMVDFGEVAPGGIVIVEGVYAIRLELASYYDLTIWVDVPKDIRFKRGLARDGKKARDRWEKDWMPMEDQYVAIQKPQLRADIVIDATDKSFLF